MLAAMTTAEIDAYKLDEDNYSVVPFKPLLDPNNAWAMPYVTGKRYKIHWRNGLDFTEMRFDISPNW